ncbi:MAG TPA: hypothetical protein ENJ97_07890, partial [Planctomycetes bacterium]|nr:hypothetical protein [Planctomycetota bacterium]
MGETFFPLFPDPDHQKSRALPLGKGGLPGKDLLPSRPGGPGPRSGLFRTPLLFPRTGEDRRRRVAFIQTQAAPGTGRRRLEREKPQKPQENHRQSKEKKGNTYPQRRRKPHLRDLLDPDPWEPEKEPLRQKTGPAGPFGRRVRLNLHRHRNLTTPPWGRGLSPYRPRPARPRLTGGIPAWRLAIPRAGMYSSFFSQLQETPMPDLAIVNGSLLPLEEARVPALDRGFLFGDSVYEVIRTREGVPFLMERHFERLQASAGRIGISLPFDLQRMSGEIRKGLDGAGYGDAYIRIIVSRGYGPPNIDFRMVEEGPSWVLMFRELSVPGPEAYREGIAAAVPQVKRNDREALDPAIKSGNYLN